MKRRYRFERDPSRQFMGRVIMKWGGGLISDKSTLCTAYADRISALAKCVGKLVSKGHEVIVVHGAGSFGHLRAREYKLSEGDIPGFDQEDAVILVRKDMDHLHEIVLASLNTMDTFSHAPRDFVKNTGAKFTGDLDRFLSPGVHITFGDVVDCDPPLNFGILSGDDLMLRLSVELPDVTHVIFAMGDTPGLMTTPGADGELIPIWRVDDQFSGQHEHGIDVTGGIFLKTERAAAISQHVEHVWFVDGLHTERILEIVENCYTYGTRISNS